MKRPFTILSLALFIGLGSVPVTEAFFTREVSPEAGLTADAEKNFMFRSVRHRSSFFGYANRNNDIRLHNHPDYRGFGNIRRDPYGAHHQFDNTIGPGVSICWLSGSVQICSSHYGPRNNRQW